MVDGSLDFLGERLRIAERKHHHGGRARPQRFGEGQVMKLQPTHRLPAATTGVKSDPALRPGARRPNSCEPDELDRIKPICIEKS
jgi:hypothetical protein